MTLKKLLVLRDEALACTSCRLSETRTNVVFGVGTTNRPPIAFVGEAPGENEDLEAEPFIGKAGKLLSKFLNGMGYNKEDVYITNTVLCRPPDNRKPAGDETDACNKFLTQQLELVKPRVIVTLGGTATQILLKSDKRIGELRGRWHTWNEIPLMATYHPSYILRDPSKRYVMEADLSDVLTFLHKRQK